MWEVIEGSTVGRLDSGLNTCWQHSALKDVTQKHLSCILTKSNFIDCGDQPPFTSPCEWLKCRVQVERSSTLLEMNSDNLGISKFKKEEENGQAINLCSLWFSGALRFFVCRTQKANLLSERKYWKIQGYLASWRLLQAYVNKYKAHANLPL